MYLNPISGKGSGAMMETSKSIFFNYSFVLFGLFFGLFASSPTYADWSGEYIRAHSISMANADKQYRVEGANDSLTLEEVEPNRWQFELFKIGRSANMCDVSGEATLLSPDVLEHKADECTLQFHKEKERIRVKDVGEQCESQCGYGVYLDNLLLSPKPVQDEKARQASPLKVLSDAKLEALSEGWRDAIRAAYIHRSKRFHNLDVDQLIWHSSNWNDNKYYLFSKDQPFFIILKQVNSREWRLINIWELEYPSETLQGDNAWEIYPALYPVSDDQNAIAITSSFNESYSGGGASFNVATIIPLEPSESVLNASQAMIDSMPFSCSALIRACFSEQDYNAYGDNRCHDNSSGFLTLKTQRSTLTQDNRFYQWRLTWHEKYLKGKSSDPLRKTKQRVRVDLNEKQLLTCEPFNEFNFCGGGTEDYCQQ